MPEIYSGTVQVHVARFDEQAGKYKFLVMKRAADVRLYPSAWQVITGTIEEGETALQTALREVKEETSLEIKRMWTVPYVASFFDPGQDRVHSAPVFGILTANDAEPILSAEHTEYKWLDLDELLSLLIFPSHREGTKVFLESILLSGELDLFEVHST